MPDNVLYIIGNGFDIDGCMSSMIGASLVHPDNPFDILAQLIAAERMTTKDIHEAFSLQLNHLYNCDIPITYKNKSSMRVCSEAGLLSIFHELYYNCQKTRKDYKDICYRTNFYLSLIEMDEVNEDFVTRTLDIFDSNYAYPYTLRNRFKVELLEQNQVFSEKFFAKLKEMGKELPESLK